MSEKAAIVLASRRQGPGPALPPRLDVVRHRERKGCAPLLHGLAHNQRCFLIRLAAFVAVDRTAKVDPLGLIEIDAEHMTEAIYSLGRCTRPERQLPQSWFI